jgi:hypothetical protein
VLRDSDEFQSLPSLKSHRQSEIQVRKSNDLSAPKNDLNSMRLSQNTHLTIDAGNKKKGE